MKTNNLIGIIITLLLINSNFDLIAQQVNKNYVVVEIGTGTWCSNCPAAARGADDLVANGHLVAVIENHNGDSYAHTTSNTRNNYYGITGYPTAFFSGVTSVVGGSYGGNMYSTYLSKYNAAIAVLSDFTLDVSYTHTGPDYDVSIVIDEVANYTNTNLKVRLALTESHISQNWQGMTELDFVNRAMYPNAGGTSYSGGAETINLNFTADSAWDLSHCELVAFVQDETTKEILQADKISLAQPTGTNNAAIMAITDLPSTCDMYISPSIRVKNFGSDNITSMDIDYSINSGETTGTYSWSGSPITLFDQLEITIEDIALNTLNATNPIEFEIVSVNGLTDDDTSNNTIDSSFEEAPSSIDDYINVFIDTADHGDECTWEITDSNGTVVESGGPYGNDDIINYVTSLTGDCYTFTVFDSAGNGGDTVILADQSNVLYYSPGTHGALGTQEFTVPDTFSTDDHAFSESLIYPNPANNILSIENAEGLNVKLYDFLGRELFSKENILSKEQISLEGITNGTYLLTLSDGLKTRIEKVLISK